MKYLYKIILMVAVALSFNGCIVNQLFSVGKEKSYCSENGCDYTDSGVCANPIEILQDKDDLSAIRQRNKEAEDAAGFFKIFN